MFHERKATWLELFFDIGYVAIFNRMSSFYVNNYDLRNVFEYMVVYIAIWWTWIQITLYSNRFDTDDLLHRISILLHMFGLGGFALSSIEVFDSTKSLIFIVSFIIIRFMLFINYTFVLVVAKVKRSTLWFNSVSNLISIVLWSISIAVNFDYKVILWFISFGIDFALAIILRQKKMPFASNHLPERFGLFTIVVLGEVLVEFFSIDYIDDVQNG